jgi:hypothetical protein
MGWLDQLSAVLGGRQPIERLAREEAHGHDSHLPDCVHENPFIGAAPPEFMRKAMTHTVQRRDLWGELGGGTLGRLASRCLRYLRRRGDFGVWHPGVLYVIVNPCLTRERVQRRLTSLPRGM